MNIIKHSMAVAHAAHAYEYRKWSGEKYSLHPKRVRNIVMLYTKDVNVIAAAALHDTIENTTVTYEELEATFGVRVADLVNEVSTYGDVTWKTKPMILLAKMMKMTDDALLIKLVDRLDNISDLHIASKSFRKRYTAETKYILDNLHRPLNSIHLKLIWDIRNTL